MGEKVMGSYGVWLERMEFYNVYLWFKLGSERKR